MKILPLLILLLVLTACAGAQPSDTPPPAATATTGAAVEEPSNTPEPTATAAPAQKEQATATTAPAAMTLTSPAFANGASIPKQYTCQGGDLSPALAWSGAPQGTQSFALIMDDPDAPGGTWVHWVVYNLPAGAGGLNEGASYANAKAYDLPQGAVQGKTSFGREDYGGPCPPSGEHRYFFKLYALDSKLEGAGLDKDSLLKAMEGHILSQGELVGLYKKK